MSLAAILEAVAADPLLWSDFSALCDAGGRLAGSDSATAGFAFAAVRMAAVGPVRNEPAAYAGWTCQAARLEHRGRLLDCAPLLGSMPCEGLELEVRDLGRGAPQPARLDGLAVMARHEYPFATHAIHRR